MISATTTLPMPETGPSVNANWIKANTIAAAVYAAVGTLTFVTDKLLAVNDPATAMTYRGVAAVIALAGTIIPIVAYAMLTGAVLSEKLPAFSKRAWIALHGSIGAVMGLGFAAYTLFGPVAKTAPVAMPPLPELMLGLGVVVVFAAIFGAVMGALQALVLRKAATGTGTWIALSALVTPLMMVALGAVAFGFKTEGGLAGTLAMQFVAFVVMIVAAAILLPALNRLVPRGQ